MVSLVKVSYVASDVPTIFHPSPLAADVPETAPLHVRIVCFEAAEEPKGRIEAPPDGRVILWPNRGGSQRRELQKNGCKTSEVL